MTSGVGVLGWPLLPAAPAPTSAARRRRSGRTYRPCGAAWRRCARPVASPMPGKVASIFTSWSWIMRASSRTGPDHRPQGACARPRRPPSRTSRRTRDRSARGTRPAGAASDRPWGPLRCKKWCAASTGSPSLPWTCRGCARGSALSISNGSTARVTDLLRDRLHNASDVRDHRAVRVLSRSSDEV